MLFVCVTLNEGFTEVCRTQSAGKEMLTLNKRSCPQFLPIALSRLSYLRPAWPHLIVEEVHSVVVKFKWKRLQEGDIVGHDFLVWEVKLVDDNGVHMVVWQEVI